jgi:nitrite reductase/ring-hydroxylating ferredoxin subunit
MKLPFTILCWLLSFMTPVESFSLVLMAKRGKGGLQKSLDGKSVSKKKAQAQSERQEITGVTLPADGKIKGWEFGDRVQVACANVGGRFYAVQGSCPRCAFDLWKGDLIADDPGFDDLPRVACPTCAITFSMVSGKYGPPMKRTGLAGFVGGLAKSATAGDKPMDAEAFEITQDDDGRVFCKKKISRR